MFGSIALRLKKRLVPSNAVYAFDDVQCNVFIIYLRQFNQRKLSSEVLTRVAVAFICADPGFVYPISNKEIMENADFRKFAKFQMTTKLVVDEILS